MPTSWLSFYMPSANSLANLRPPWQAGQSGNRAGRPNTGGSLIEYIHELGSESEPGVAKYPLEELEAIGADQRCSHTKAMAAQLIMLARTPGFHEKSGKPYCAMLVDMILDRTVGKPVQAVHVHKTETPVPAEFAATVVDLLAQRADVLGAALAKATPHVRAKAMAMLPVDTTAEPIVVEAEGVEPVS